MLRHSEEVPLVSAAKLLGRSYRATLDAVLRGELVGRQDRRGRWLVSAASVAALVDVSTTGELQP